MVGLCLVGPRRGRDLCSIQPLRFAFLCVVSHCRRRIWARTSLASVKNKCLLLLVLPFATVITSITPYFVHQQKAPTLSTYCVRIKPPACTCIYARETMNRGMRRASSEQPNDPGRLCPEHCSERMSPSRRDKQEQEGKTWIPISSRHDTQAFFIPNLIHTGSNPFTVLASHNNVCTAKTFRVLYGVQIVPFHLIQHSFVCR